MARVLIRYKSGQSVEVEVQEFAVTRTNSEITQIEWKSIDPRPLYMGLDSIESIWEM